MLVVVTVGRRNDPSALGPQPANVAVHQYIPQATLLPHCQAAVIHGGDGTMLGALAAGLPLTEHVAYPPRILSFHFTSACGFNSAMISLLVAQILANVPSQRPLVVACPASSLPQASGSSRGSCLISGGAGQRSSACDRRRGPVRL